MRARLVRRSGLAFGPLLPILGHVPVGVVHVHDVAAVTAQCAFVALGIRIAGAMPLVSWRTFDVCALLGWSQSAQSVTQIV